MTSSTAERRGEHPDPKGRLRHGFLRRASQQLHELSDLLAGGGVDERDHVEHALEDMADTARTLGLSAVGQAAEAAATQVALGATGRALSGVAQVLRAGLVAPQFGPIALVTGGHEHLLGDLDWGAAESLRIVPSVDALLDAVWFEDLQGVIAPVKPRRRLHRLATAAPERTFAWGPAGDGRKRRTAALDGAVAYFGLPLTPARVLRRIRLATWRRLAGPPRVSLVAAAGDRAAVLAEAMTAQGLDVRGAAGPEELRHALSRACPDVVLLSPPFDGGDVGDAVALVRGHPAGFDLPVVLWGEEAWCDLPLGTVDERIPANLGPAGVARALRARRDRPRGLPGRDRLTGLPGRPGILARLDDEVARARRTREPLAVAVVDVDDLSGLNDRAGREMGDRALRLLAGVLRRGVRRYDLVGRLGGDAFLVALPGCEAGAAGRRVVELQQVLEAARDDTPGLDGLAFSAGVADSQRGLDGLLSRVDGALALLREAGARGAVEVAGGR